MSIILVQIAPALNQTVTLTTDIKIDLAPFKSLISLRVSGITKYLIIILTVYQLEGLEVDNCDGLELIYTQLVCLEVYRSKNVLWVRPINVMYVL